MRPRLAFPHHRSVGSPGGPGVGSRFDSVEIGPSGDGADDDAVAFDDSHDSQESFR